MIGSGPLSSAALASAAVLIASAVGLGPEASAVSALAIYGPMGIMLIWFAWRAEQKSDKVAEHLNKLGHRIEGMTRAMLADVISRDTSGPEAKRIAQQMLTKIESSDDKRPSL
jgi:membrane protein implicated in regulation of membrane protease activity